MRVIDLNCDLGEGGLHDAALIGLASSANIACGGHAGNEDSMQAAIAACLARGVAVGAHPGYEDRDNFGRQPLALAPAMVAAQVSRQLHRLARIAQAAGAPVHHVKPHGALYHQADRDPVLAAAFTQAVVCTVPGCLLYVPPAGALAAAAAAAGLPIRPEGFADRRYRPDGSLVPRSEPGACITCPAEAAAQAMELAGHGRVRTIAGDLLSLSAETLCVHGDGPEAIRLLQAVREALAAAGIQIQA